jgi:4-hydroxy-3-polyprenylbenzoate decarboxylase
MDDSAMVAETASRPHWRDLREWLALVESRGELHRIAAQVDPDEEVGAITFMGSRELPSPALMFERFADNPHGARVLTNMLGASTSRYALALGLDPTAPIRDLVEATRRITKQRISPVWVASQAAPVDEIVLEGRDIDLTKLPVPKFWPLDGGPFIGTGGITITADPRSGRLNVGCYRQQLHGPTRIGLNFVPGRHGESDMHAAWAAGKPAEVVAAFGIDPVLFMVSAMKFPPGESELDAAGGMMGAPIELTKARHVSLPIPARAEIVIEGLVHQGDVETEGPLGEFHGFYSGGSAKKPVIEVKALHMRPRPILTGALMATYPSCENGAHMAIMRSARILDDLDRMGVPSIKAVYCHPAAASGNCLAVVSIDQKYPGHSGQALALTAQCPTASYYTKWIVVVDGDVDPTNLEEVFWAMSTRCNPSSDLDILRGAMTFRADPSVPPEEKPFGSKVLVNACTPWKRIGQPPIRALLRRPVYENVRSRWSELAMPTRAPDLDTFQE